MQNTIILLIEQIVVALGGEFKLYLPQLIPHMLRVFMHDNSPGRSVTIKVYATSEISVNVALKTHLQNGQMQKPSWTINHVWNVTEIESKII